MCYDQENGGGGGGGGGGKPVDELKVTTTNECQTDAEHPPP